MIPLRGRAGCIPTLAIALYMSGLIVAFPAGSDNSDGLLLVVAGVVVFVAWEIVSKGIRRGAALARNPGATYREYDCPSCRERFDVEGARDPESSRHGWACAGCGAQLNPSSQRFVGLRVVPGLAVFVAGTISIAVTLVAGMEWHWFVAPMPLVLVLAQQWVLARTPDAELAPQPET